MTNDREAAAEACNDALACTTPGRADPDGCVLALRVALAHAERWQHGRRMEERQRETIDARRVVRRRVV